MGESSKFRVVPEFRMLNIGPDTQFFFLKNHHYFVTHQIKHVFLVLKRTVSLRRSFEYQNICFG